MDRLAGWGLVVRLDALDALQAERVVTPPYPQDAAAGGQVAGL